MLSKKYYQEFADELIATRIQVEEWREMDPDKTEAALKALAMLEDKMISFFQWDNERFDAVKFMEASRL